MDVIPMPATTAGILMPATTAGPDSEDTALPPFLRATEPMEVEDLPLQVALLTMELANLRRMLGALGTLLLTPQMEGFGDERST